MIVSRMENGLEFSFVNNIKCFLIIDLLSLVFIIF